MEAAIIFVVLIIIGGIAAAFRQSSAQNDVYGPARELQRRFQSLGDLQGKTRTEIEAAVGAPNSVSSLADGILCQWQRTGYHIALLFKDDICQGITHEYVA